MFAQSEIAFEPGLYKNRSRRASKQRWVEGNLVRFTDGVPCQVGGWHQPPVAGVSIAGRARDMIAWRPNNQHGRLCMIGTHTNAYRFDGGAMIDVTPDDFAGGRADSLIGAGFGAGLYGDGDYGTERDTSANTLDASMWTMDLFGDVALACFTGDGVIYEYSEAPDAKLAAVENAPSARAICVSDERHVFAFGCDGNPALVQWSDREDRTVWTPASTNRAGSYEMRISSVFQCGRRCRGLVLAWTQTELFSFAPLANSLVYSKDRLGTQCGVMGPQTVAIVTDVGGEVAYWMSPHAFYAYDGLVREIPCELREYVFEDLNIIQRAKFQARSNTLYNEIWFFYCSADAGEIDRCVIYNYGNQTWTKAGLSRLAWLDAGIFPLPIAVDAEGALYEHEYGAEADGAAIDSYVISHPITLGVGQQLTELSEFWPDMDPLSGTAALTVISRDSPGGDETVHGPFSFTAADDKIDLAVNAREVQIKIAGVSGYWELGLPLITRQAGGGR